MREHKDSDSPSGYDREVQPRRRPTREELHSGEATYIPPRQPGMDTAACLTAFAQRLTGLNDQQAMRGSNALALMDPRDIAAQLVGAAKAAQLGGASESFELIGALALAGLMAASRADELRVDSGEAAA